MSASDEAARRLLHDARAIALPDAPSLVLAAAAMELERAERGAGFRAASSFTDPRLSLLLTAAAGNAAASMDEAREQVARAASRVPPGDLAEALYQSEAFLARIDAAWSWQLAVSLLGADGAAASVVGLYLSRTVDVTTLPRPEPFLRRLAADQTARAAIRGEVLSADDPRLQPLVSDPRGRALFGFEADGLLVASAFVDPALGLRFADSLCETGKPSAAALTIVARRAVAAGMANEIAQRAPSYVDWTQAAAFAGALAPDEVETLVTAFVPSVVDDAEPGRKYLGAVPLLAALAATERVEAFAALARSAAMPPLSIAQLLANLRCSAFLAALARNETFLEWTSASPDAWAETLGGGPRLLPNDASADVRSQAVVDALIVAANAPWTVVPGSLDDELGP